MELTYTKNGDYFIPNLVIPEEKRPIKKYGNLRKKYLKEYHTGIYQGMLLSNGIIHRAEEMIFQELIYTL